MSKEKAEEIFALILKFGGYGFNKSHCTRYAIVAYQTAYMKTYLPVEYMAALLTFEMVDRTRSSSTSTNAGIFRSPAPPRSASIFSRPDINQSDADFTVVDESNPRPPSPRRHPLRPRGHQRRRRKSRPIHHRGRKPMSRAPADQPYKSLFDFCERVDLRVVNKSVMESLIKCGAFDALHPIRAAAFAAVETASRMAQQAQEAKRAGQESLFGTLATGPTVGILAPSNPNSPPSPNGPRAKKWPTKNPSSASTSPTTPSATSKPSSRATSPSTPRPSSTPPTKAPGTMGGLVSKIRLMTTKSGPNAGSRWAILLIEDLVGSMEVVLYSNEYTKFQEMIKPDAVLFFEGNVDKTREEPSFKAKEVYTLDAVQKKKTREILIQTNSVKLDDATLDALQKILKENKGSTPVKLELSDLTPQPHPSASNSNSARRQVDLNIQNGAVPALQALFGEHQVQPLGPNRKQNAPPPPSPKRRCWRPVMNWWKWRNEVTTPSPSAPHPPRDFAGHRIRRLA